MKSYLKSSGKIRLILSLLFVSFFFQLSRAGEFVIMNQVISWDISSADAFWSFKPDATMPANWLTPDNYYNGTIYTRYEVLDVATDIPFGMQFDLFQWKDPEHKIEGELCEDVRWLTNGVGSVVESSSSPNSWYKVNEGVDFSKISDIQSLSITIWCNDPRAPISRAGEGGDAAGLAWPKRFNWFPATIRVTVVAVSYGSTFSGWENYIADPVTLKPTPTYGIDFPAETTDKVVPATDEYSLFPGMAYSTSGNGEKISLTPGRIYYFRTKAGDGLKASEIQRLAVPERPATPTFSIDLVNHRTATTVNSTYEYSDNSDMSGAVSGSGDYVSIPAGITKYFRKKSTASSFSSNTQSLNESSKLPIAHEFVIFNGIVDYPNSTDTNGFYYFWHNADMPVNWRSPDDYYNGEVWMRYEIISQQTPTPVGMQFGIWQKLQPETGELYETMSEIATLNGPGSIATTHSSPRSWWTLNRSVDNHGYTYNGVDYTRMNLTWHFGINPWKVSTGQQIRQENPGVWNERNTYWFPMKAYVTVIAVADGHTFSGWDNYLDVPAAPTYAIDYINECTNIAVPATDQYANNPAMTGAVSGTGIKLPLTPGQVVYFRTKAHDDLPASKVQTLSVPERPAAPAFTYDRVNQRTSVQVSSAYEYSDSPSMTGAVTGNGNYVNVAQGTSKYFRRKATGSSFKSDIQELKGTYDPPATPVYEIDFVNETTKTAFVATDEYSSDLISWTSGTGSALAITPGQDIYIRTKAQGYIPPSDTLQLDVPLRPTAPAFSIDYINEETAEIVTNDYQYASNAAMTSPVSGIGNYPKLTPGIPVYFRKKATSSSFASEVETLNVPARPAAPAFAINYSNETTQSAVSSDYLYADNSGMAYAVAGTGTNVDLTPGTTLYFRKKANSSSFASEIQALVVPARPSTPAFAIDFGQEKTATNVTSEYQYATQADMNSAVTGSGVRLSVTPGNTLYLRKVSTSGSFASLIQTLDVPERPATPSYTINYETIKTNETVSTADDYSANSSMSGAIAGTNIAINLTPGTNLYFRTRATSSSFSSLIQSLIVEERPSTPFFTIDYAINKTNEIVSDQIEISEHSNLTDPVYGTGEKLAIEPGVDLYFRQKAGNNSFNSNIFHLAVPSRNTLDYFGSDTITTNVFTLRANIINGAFSLDNLMISNGTAKNLREGNIFDVYANSKGPVVVVIPANSVVDNSFASNIIRIYYKDLSTGFSELEDKGLSVYPNPSEDGFVNILNESNESYRFEIISLGGTLVRTYPEYEGTHQPLNLSSLAKGIYFIKVYSGNKISMQKLIIE